MPGLPIPPLAAPVAWGRCVHDVSAKHAVSLDWHDQLMTAGRKSLSDAFEGSVDCKRGGAGLHLAHCGLGQVCVGALIGGLCQVSSLLGIAVLFSRKPFVVHVLLRR